MKSHDKSSSVAGWDIVTVQGFDELGTIRTLWEEMQRNQSSPVPNTDIDRYLSILDPIKDTMQPYIILLHHNSKPEAMLLGQIGKMQMKCKVGYLTLIKPHLQCLAITYRGILGQPRPEGYSVLIAELLNVLNSGRVDVVLFNHLPVDSEMYYFARITPSVLSCGYFPKVEPHWTMLVPKDIGLFYKALSKKHRSNLKRYMRKLENEHAVRVQTFYQEEMLDEAITRATEISSRTYQHGLNSGFVDDAQTRSLLTTAAKRRWLRFHILFIDDKPCAFQLGLQYQRTYFLEQMGFDPKWKQWCIGTTLFLKVLEELCHDPLVDSFDFGFGDSQYKQSYGDNRWLEATIYIFASRVFPMLINIVHSSTAGLSKGMSFLACKIALECWVKRRWRNLLQQGNQRVKA